MAKRNGFWYFMTEMMKELKAQGEEISSFAEMPAIASPKWQALSAQERERYKAMSQGMAINRTFDDDSSLANESSESKKMNNQCEPVGDYEKREHERTDRLLRLDDDVKNLRLTWPSGDKFINERFFLVHFEYFVLTEDGYLPCEVAGIEFSLKEGIVGNFQSFIDPGPCPMGYMYEERYRSEQRHQIPLCDRFDIPEFTDDDRCRFKDHAAIYEDLIHMFSRGHSIGIPIVFTWSDDIEMVEACFSYLAVQGEISTGSPRALPPRVLPLERLVQLFYLHSKSENVTTVPSRNSVQRVLTQSIWDYVSGIRCHYHEQLEVRDCTLSQLYRWCFAIFDAIKSSQVYEFDLTERHLPSLSKFETKVAHASRQAVTNCGGGGDGRNKLASCSSSPHSPRSNIVDDGVVGRIAASLNSADDFVSAAESWHRVGPGSATSKPFLYPPTAASASSLYDRGSGDSTDKATSSSSRGRGLKMRNPKLSL